MNWDPGQLLIGAAIAAVAGSVGFFAKRIITNEKAREEAALFSNWTTIAATLKKEGLTTADAEAVAVTLETRKKRKKNQKIPIEVESDDLADAASPYWTTTAMKIRAYASADVEDAQLKAVIAELNTLMPWDYGNTLEEAQKAWEVFVEKQMDFAGAEVSGGTMEGLIRIAERESLTIQRTKDLQSLVDQMKPK